MNDITPPEAKGVTDGLAPDATCIGTGIDPDVCTTTVDGEGRGEITPSVAPPPPRPLRAPESIRRAAPAAPLDGPSGLAPAPVPVPVDSVDVVEGMGLAGAALVGPPRTDDLSTPRVIGAPDVSLAADPRVTRVGPVEADGGMGIGSGVAGVETDS